MDWNRVRSEGQRIEPPAPTMLETCWRLRTPSGKTLTCSIVRDAAPGVEIRAGYSDDDVLRSQRSIEIGTAREIAAAWRDAVIAKGGFTVIASDKA